MKLPNDTVWLELYKINVSFSQVLDERKNYEYLDLVYFIQLEWRENGGVKRSYGQTLLEHQLLFVISMWFNVLKIIRQG